MPKFIVSLPPGARNEFEAKDEADAIAQYNAWSGVLGTDNQYAVGRVDEPSEDSKPKRGSK